MKPIRSMLRKTIGWFPTAVYLDYQLRWKDQPIGGFRMEKLRAALPEMVEDVLAAQHTTNPGKKVFVFATLHYWVQHASAVAMALAGQGHEVTLGFLPYANWHSQIDTYQVLQQNAYARSVLKLAKPVINIEELIHAPRAKQLPEALQSAVERTAYIDTQYTEQIEEVSKDSPLYRFRIKRNRLAAQIALRWLQEDRPDALVVPNGLIFEFGILFQVARYLNIPVSTYEFGEQKERVWLAQNDAVMYQDTSAMWQAVKDQSVDESQNERIKTLVSARQGATLWNNFYRKWQDSAAEGAEAVKKKIGLDERPMVLMATNVLGDSLTLDRQVFTGSLTAWVKRTLDYFISHPEVQFVLRTHPGELAMDGPSVAEIAKAYLNNEVPENIHLIAPDASVNTYDLILAANLGITYTTTVGLEMAMSGLPVIAVGKTHYRGKGFTMDPNSWEEYFTQLDQALQSMEAQSLDQAQIKAAWAYAYRFFFNYPRVFPWHLMHFWEDLAEKPMAKVLSPQGLKLYQPAFNDLIGEAIDWSIEAI